MCMSDKNYTFINSISFNHMWIRSLLIDLSSQSFFIIIIICKMCYENKMSGTWILGFHFITLYFCFRQCLFNQHFVIKQNVGNASVRKSSDLFLFTHSNVCVLFIEHQKQYNRMLDFHTYDWLRWNRHFHRLYIHWWTLDNIVRFVYVINITPALFL